jgi:hypothetical protein
MILVRTLAGLRVSPGLEAGARRRATRRFLLVVFKTLQLSKIVQGLALKTGGKKGNHGLMKGRNDCLQV